MLWYSSGKFHQHCSSMPSYNPMREKYSHILLRDSEAQGDAAHIQTPEAPHAVTSGTFPWPQALWMGGSAQHLSVCPLHTSHYWVSLIPPGLAWFSPIPKTVSPFPLGSHCSPGCLDPLPPWPSAALRAYPKPQGTVLSWSLCSLHQ